MTKQTLPIDAQKLWLSTLDQFHSLEQRAAQILDPLTFEFITSGPNCGAGISLYREAFRRYALVPRAPAEAEIDLSVKLLGTTYDTPLMIAPTGFVGRVHPDCEVAIARAARPRRVPMMCSTYTAQPLEHICEALGDVPRWFQLYWVKGREGAATLIERAEAAGAVGIAVTVDTALVPMRPEVMLEAFADQLAHDPLDRTAVGSRLTSTEVTRRVHEAAIGDPTGLTRDDVRWICESTALPVLAKGVLSAETALRMLECGVDGVIVSNHGGQLLDSGIPALQALPAVRLAVGQETPVLFDSGIRTGSDIVKALALGADSVLVGRPCLLGLATDGELGVGHVLDDLLRDLRVVLAGIGCRSINELDGTYVERL